MNTRRPARAALIAAGLIAAVAGCGGTPAAPPAGPPPGADPAAATAAATTDVCTNLLKIDGTPSPDSGPDGPAPVADVKAWGATLVPLLDGAVAQAPAAQAGGVLVPSLTALQPFVSAAAEQGTEPDFENQTFTGALAGYEMWAHANCGYQQVALAGTDFEFTGAPATLDAGPVSVLLTNESTDEQFHVALFAKPKDQAMTLEQFVATPLEELFGAVDLVPGGAPAAPGQTGGALFDLEPGKYFLLCPVGEEGQLPHHVQGMINEVTVT